MKRILQTTLLSITAALLLSGTAMASVINFDSSFNVIAELQEYTFINFLPGIDMKIESRRAGETLTWDASDNGIGIVDDEITGGYTDWTNRETLRFTFSDEVMLSSLMIVDLFPQEGTAGELGAYKLDYANDGLSFGDFTEVTFGPGNAAGNMTLDINEMIVGINLFAVNDPVYDFAVAGMDVAAPVPEPGTVLLLGGGLIGLALYRRKRH